MKALLIGAILLGGCGGQVTSVCPVYRCNCWCVGGTGGAQYSFEAAFCSDDPNLVSSMLRACSAESHLTNCLMGTCTEEMP